MSEHQHDPVYPVYPPGYEATNAFCDTCGHFPMPLDGARAIPIGSATIYRPDSLDAAWAEAEAALPEGWHVSIYPIRGGTYRASASLRTLGLTPEGITQSDLEPTPAAALRALAAKFREQGS